MTPEKEIVEAAVAWRRAWLSVGMVADLTKPMNNKKYRQVVAMYQQRMDETAVFKDKLNDLLDQYIQEDKD